MSVWDLCPGRRASLLDFEPESGLAEAGECPVEKGPEEVERGLGMLQRSINRARDVVGKRRDQAYRESQGGRLEMDIPFWNHPRDVRTLQCASCVACQGARKEQDCVF